MDIFNLNNILTSNKELLKRKEEIQPDFYFALYPLVIEIENCLKNILIKVNFKSFISIDDENWLIKNLAGQINVYLKENLLSYSLIHEIEIAREANILTGNTNKDQFAFFIKNITTDIDWMSYYFEKYPLLTKRLNIQINNYLIYINDLLVSFTNSINDIENKILFEKITTFDAIDLFLGDPHKNGKTVSLVQVNNNSKIVYKPRSSENEKSFEKFIKFINSLGANLEVGFPKIILSENSSWMEFIHHDEVLHLDDIELYYNNLGKLLCVFYILGTHDIMPDNIIVKNKVPYLIDLECLLYRPNKKHSKNFNSMFSQSVISSGVLPSLSPGNDVVKDLVRSLFFKINSQKIKSIIWEKNDFEFTQKVSKVNANQGKEETHLPRLKGEQIEMNYNYLRLFIEGFKVQYDFFIINKTQIENFIRSGVFDDVFIRNIVHDTIIYDLLLREGIIPEYLEGIEDINEIYERVLKGDLEFSRKEIMNSILQQMNVGDIPYFYTYNKGVNSLYSGDGNIISKYYYESGLTGEYLILERLNNLSINDLKFQINIIELTSKISFDMLNIVRPRENSFVYMNKEKLLLESNINFEKNNLLEAADIIGKELLNKIFYCKDSNEYNWIWKNRDIDGTWGVVPLNYDLYDGLSGMSIFYLYLYKYTNEKKYLNVSKTLFLNMKNTFLKMVKHYKKLPIKQKETYPISPFSFPLSLLFLSEHFSFELSEEYKDIYIYEEIYQIIDKYLDYSINTDILTGQAGLLQLLLSIKSNNNLLESLKKKCVANIYRLSTIQKDGTVALGYKDPQSVKSDSLYLGGFAHGSSGISSVLLKYATIESDSVAKELGLKILEHDRTQFIKNINGWRDGREGVGDFDSGCWCHGSSGVALSRLLIADFYYDDLINDEIYIAKKNIIDIGIGGNQSLCHGDLGNLEILRGVNNFLKNNDSINFVENYLTNLAFQYKNSKKFKTGEDGEIPLINLFMGLAGIGYGFLRHYDWENTPSVLALETPYSLNTYIH